MSEMETKDDVETEAFTDDLSDEALDREQGGGKYSVLSRCGCPGLVPADELLCR
jgi:hypothetical protein